MKIKDIINKVQTSEAFSQWEKGDSYLVHVFKMYDKENENTWQVGYYNPDSDKVTPIDIEQDEIRVGQECEVFKKEDKVLELLPDNVKIDIDDAIKKAKDLQAEKYKGSDPLKIIVILQNIQDNIVYNITFVTQNFKTLNIKVDAADGNITSDKLTSIFEFKAGEKGRDDIKGGS
jgi:uncharacterized membrane protein YkoI